MQMKMKGFNRTLRGLRGCGRLVLLELLERLGRVHSPESCDVSYEAVLLDLGAAHVSTKATLPDSAVIPPLEAGTVVLVGVPAVGWWASKQQVDVGDLLRQSRFEVGDIGLEIILISKLIVKSQCEACRTPK